MPEEQNESIPQSKEGELRKYYRLDSIHFVTYQNVTPTKFGIQEGLATTENISTGGILLVCEIPFPESTVLEMEMALKDEIISAKGIVARCMESTKELGKYELGIKFTEIDDNSKNAIARLIAKSMLARSKAEEPFDEDLEEENQPEEPEDTDEEE